MIRPPASEDELLRRAQDLAGHSLTALAEALHQRPHADARRRKGFAGELLEAALGATASSRAEPDFPHLGVEMKTLPVTPDGRPQEATYVCTLPLDGSLGRSWDEAWVRRKLARVLWVPLVADGDERTIGTPFLWTPDAEEEATLQADWEEVATLVATGELAQLTARHGAALHVRPKGRNQDDRTWRYDADGEWVSDMKRGFYLRPSFTGAVLRRALRTR